MKASLNPRRVAAVHWHWTIAVVLGAIVLTIAATRFPPVRAMFIPGEQSSASKNGESSTPHSHDEHGHDHDHPGHDEANSIELSEQARKNIGLELFEVKLQPFERTISVPGIVILRPSRSTVEVTAPLTGVVTRIYPLEGEAVEPGQPLFDLRLTHEELVQAQSNFLQTAEQLDVVRREVARREQVASGAIAGKAILEYQYELQKQEAALRAQEQALLLHGLSKDQVQQILESRKLLHSLTVYAPSIADMQGTSDASSMLQVQGIRIEQGQHVEAGLTLCSLVDQSQLYIEGKAFEQDSAAINDAAAKQWKVSAVLESGASREEIIPGLELQYVDAQINRDSRSLRFFVTLPNVILRENKTAEGRTFLYWKYKPGQRMQIRVPVEKWEQRIVLPIDAIAQDGPETYVFLPNGDHFDRRAVHVEFRDRHFAVIANDGSLYPGDHVASAGAHLLQLALKNQSGGGVDPHAGHNH